mgnify:CR=1 FL=1
MGIIRTMKKQGLFFYPLLLGMLLLLCIGSLAYGAVPIPVSEIADILLGKGSERTAWEHIVLHARLPQAVTALLAGASLATGGLLLQTLLSYWEYQE